MTDKIKEYMSRPLTPEERKEIGRKLGGRTRAATPGALSAAGKKGAAATLARHPELRTSEHGRQLVEHRWYSPRKKAEAKKVLDKRES